MIDPLFATALHALTVEVEGALYIVDLREGTCFGLNGTAASIWRGLVDGRSPADVARELAAGFRVDQARARADVAALISALVARGLVMDGVLDPPPG
jgi:hypothetical protein